MKTLREFVAENFPDDAAMAQYRMLVERDQGRSGIVDVVHHTIMKETAESPEALRGAILVLDLLTTFSGTVLESVGWEKSDVPLAEVMKAIIPMTLMKTVIDPATQAAVRAEEAMR